ncbi:MAG: YceI family protein [Pseudomonadota bacterium]
MSLASLALLALALIPDASAAEQRLALDPARSGVTALGSKVIGSHLLSFPALAGEVVLSEGAPRSLEVTVVMGELSTDIASLTAHLLSPDFFDTASFPKARFVSSRIAPGNAAAGATHTVTGALTIHGITREVSFPATITVSPQGFRGQAELTLDRQDYGVSFPGKSDNLIRDAVVLTVDLAG